MVNFAKTLSFEAIKNHAEAIRFATMTRSS